MADWKLTTTDPATIYETVIQSLVDSVQEELEGGDERRLFGEALVGVLVNLFNSIDYSAKQTALRYATGEVLDALGERLDVERLEGSSAETTLEYSVQTPLDIDIEIPKYSKVKSQSNIYFYTTEKVVLKAGMYSVEVEAASIGTGNEYNGILPDSLTSQVDIIPYVYKVTNITETSGGDDGEPYTDDGDDHYRTRIKKAASKLSCAGPKGAYEYYGLTADPNIIDLKAFSDYEKVKKNVDVVDGKLFIGGSHIQEDTLKVFHNGVESDDYSAEYEDDLLTIALGESFTEDSVYVEFTRTLESHVKIIPLMEGGELPSDEVKAKILDVLNDRKVRPLTDYVEVQSPRAVSYDIDLTWYCSPETEDALEAAIEGSGGILDQYIEWQDTALGRDINPDRLRQMILSTTWTDDTGIDGSFRIEVKSPTYVEVDDTEVAQWSGVMHVNHIVSTGVI